MRRSEGLVELVRAHEPLAHVRLLERSARSAVAQRPTAECRQRRAVPVNGLRGRGLLRTQPRSLQRYAHVRRLSVERSGHVERLPALVLPPEAAVLLPSETGALFATVPADLAELPPGRAAPVLVARLADDAEGRVAEDELASVGQLEHNSLSLCLSPSPSLSVPLCSAVCTGVSIL